ncbi:MAG: preprotein translocase subunit YajC [Angelakisella sp.]|jgi:preprotein translocase subunit YajC|nr:preprotein translocase subunit YajC [Angelakisella sp.]MBS7324367.1 preprotein translocase subunit YajC [Angelakisella sp.]
MNFAFLETASGSGSMWSSIIMMALIILVFWFFIIRPQRKKDKETAKMRSELQIGDEIVTIGGIIGIIVSMKEDSLVIETGSDRSKIRVTRWAISGKNTTAEQK